MDLTPGVRPALGQIPTQPGVYRWFDAEGRVLYVGKAINLRSRLTNYFQDSSRLHPRTIEMIRQARRLEWTVVSTEVEALSLEYSWIKEFDPRFNVKYRDDKSYPYLAITMGEEYPRVLVMRGEKRAGTRYFGPYSHAWAIRETVDLLLRVFPIRSCTKGVFNRARSSGRPCLLGYIDKCSAPCVGRIDAATHRLLAEDFCDFMAGDTGRFVARVRGEMGAAAAAQNYERAAQLRDDLAALEKVVERNAVVLADNTDADVFAIASDELESSVQVFHVRGGRIRGQHGWIVEKNTDLTDGEVIEQLLGQVYDSADDLPREVLVPVEPPDHQAVEAWLTRQRGARVRLRVPQRGDKKTLAETVHTNAVQALALHKVRRSGDLTTRSQALREIADALELAEAPLRIECYDISTTQGTHQVGSMVVFEDGLPKKSDYRHFVIRGEHGEGATDDTAAVAEVMTRRFARAAAEGSTPARTTLPDAEAEVAAGESDAETAVEAQEAAGPARTQVKRFAYRPGLVVIDGGEPQVKAARAAMVAAGAADIPVVGLAKRLEELWVPGARFPLILPRTSEGLYLLQRVRDEAHRFAIAHHRKRRAAAMTTSVLDDVPGLGPSRQAALLQHFGSVKKMRAATAEQIAAVKGIGPALAASIVACLSGDSER